MVGANRSRVLFAVMQASLLGPLISSKDGQKFSYMGLAKITLEDLEVLAEFLREAKISPLIDRRFPFSQVVEAFCYLGEGHARGKVVISMDETAQGVG
jgi:NADPH:quinone reductase-like Zn-dependent oxidoreductase